MIFRLRISGNLRVSSQELAEQQHFNLQSSNAEFQVTFWQDSLKLLWIALSSWDKKISWDRYHNYFIFSFILNVITHSLSFARLYRLPCVTWYKITRKLSRNSLHLRRYLFFDYFRRMETKTAEKKPAWGFYFFYLYYYTWKENELASWSPMVVTLIKKLISNAAPESTKDSTKFCSQ